MNALEIIGLESKWPICTTPGPDGRAAVTFPRPTKAVKVTPKARDYAKQCAYMRKLRAGFKAAGLNADGKPYVEADCKACDGKGWHTTGDTDNAMQLQCSFCHGTGHEVKP